METTRSQTHGPAWITRRTACSALIAGGLPAAPPAAAADLARRDAPVPASFFGLHIHQPTKLWPALDFGRLRLWDAGTSWLDLQPEAGRWVFDHLDAIVALAQRHQVEVVLPFGLSPKWAAARPDEPSPYGKPGAASEPARIEDWRNYVGTVARRYKGRVRCYEVWNEVNAGTGFFSGTPQAMLDLQRAAYATLKEVDPGIVFVSPSSVGESDGQLAWFERYLALAGGRDADVVGYHFYAPRRTPEALIPLVARVRAIMARTGHGALPLWNTESGYRIDWGTGARVSGVVATWPNLTPALGAAYVSRSLLVGWSAGLDAYYWYALDDGLFGLAAPGATDGPAVAAYRATRRWMLGARVGPCAVSDGAWVCPVERDGRRLWLAWTEGADALRWRLPAALPARSAAALDGSALALNDGAAPLGPIPIVLSEDAHP